jgi:hypothetical protein
MLPEILWSLGLSGNTLNVPQSQTGIMKLSQSRANPKDVTLSDLVQGLRVLSTWRYLRKKGFYRPRTND